MFSASAPPATDDDGDDNTIIVIWWWWWWRQDHHHEATLTSRYPGAACIRFLIQTNLTELHCITNIIIITRSWPHLTSGPGQESWVGKFHPSNIYPIHIMIMRQKIMILEAHKQICYDHCHYSHRHHTALKSLKLVKSWHRQEQLSLNPSCRPNQSISSIDFFQSLWQRAPQKLLTICSQTLALFLVAGLTW